jgi:hypothetical protein
VAHLFDEIYYQDFVCLEDDGNSFSRELFRQCHAYFFEAGSKMELLDFNPNKIEIKFFVTNDFGDAIIIHSCVTIKDMMFVEKRPFDRSFQHHHGNAHYVREMRRGYEEIKGDTIVMKHCNMIE